ncbi:MAG: type II/IV secretion system protein [Chlamydiae bacterium]|nr:type II/IV secretion system protein [Chlamydiota bacterium]
MMKNFEEGCLLAKKLDIPILDSIKDFDFVQKSQKIIPYLFAKEHLHLALEEKNNKIVVALNDPLNFEAIKELKFLLQKEIQIVFASKECIEEAIELCYHQKEEETKHLFVSSKEEQNNSSLDEYDLLERSAQNPAVQILNAVLMEALQQGASDIHFEPYENKLNIRYRLDGILQSRRSPPSEYASQIISRIKVMAKLDIAEKRLPQDGRIKLKMGKREIDFRVSTVPIIWGERIVLRILDKSNLILGLNKLGMDDRLLNNFQKMLHSSEGIVLVTGPTGSGKTTTLYSAISELSATEKNIITIEDPVEYKLSNIAQIAVNPKINLNFARGLRHILRQDPDIIMIGEIRDFETAEIAIQSALTGHLVLSTLHTNDAPSALTRLSDMGIEPYLLSSSIVGILAQRLVRKICVHCKELYKPTLEELKELNLDVDELYLGKGCNQCFNTGYKGRVGIYELMNISLDVKKQIMKSVDAEEIKKALQGRFFSLRDSGSILVKEGITSPSEVFRVTKIVE